MTKLNACMLPGSSSYFSEEQQQQQKNTITAQRFTAYTTSNYVTRYTEKLIRLDEYHSLLNTANNTMPYSSSIFAKKHKHPSFAFFSQIAI